VESLNASPGLADGRRPFAEVESPLAEVQSHRVLRTFGFIDIGGFTRYANVEGDDRAVQQLSEFRAIVRSVGSATGVRVAKWLGDGAMLVSTEAPALVRAVIEVMRRTRRAELDLPVHAGVAQGQVILFEGDDHIGATVNLAARLADLAGPWQIFAPADTLPGLERAGAIVGELTVPGFDHPIRVADLALVADLVEVLNL
jgi:class 3 adenylate cyclase